MGEAQQPRERLRETLRELEAELHSARRVDPELRARLEQAIEELRAALSRSDATGPSEAEHHSFADHLGDAMRRFEASHPKLSLAVGRVVDALSNLGI